ncbi:hypothetical protein ACFRUQ_14125, partial [Streptomyces goshikiensis]
MKVGWLGACALAGSLASGALMGWAAPQAQALEQAAPSSRQSAPPQPCHDGPHGSDGECGGGQPGPPGPAGPA